MKYFRVEEEFISVRPHRVEVLADGLDVYNSEYEVDECRNITLGYYVFEENEPGITQNVKFYPVQTDMRTSKNNKAEVLEQIKQDYPAGEWQNNNW